MKILPASIRTAKSLAKNLHKQIQEFPGFEHITLQKSHEIYARCLGYSSWFELASRLNGSGSSCYLGDLPERVRIKIEQAIWSSLSEQLNLDPSASFAHDIARLSGLGYSPQDAAKMKQLSTPWGPAEHITEVAPGIQRISTASHGGYRLSKARQQQLSHALGADIEWFEQDEEAAIVEAAFPFAFDQFKGLKRLYDIYPELVVPICGISAEEFFKNRTEQLLKMFHDHPGAWFIGQSIGHITEVSGEWHGVYALSGRAFLQWLQKGDVSAGSSGRYFMVSPPPGTSYWTPSMTYHLGEMLTADFTPAPVGVESVPDVLSSLLGKPEPRHSCADFMRRVRSANDLLCSDW
ncbi:TPA: hypothetical protein MXR76_005351 [Pseudomonas aeruginosa]|uniref:DUF7007 domain-containing protein n=1 Tax=Pseudomonas aeruginosa TaxID=287 RepID=UPI00093F7369|nr:hypothetical protein [Pseudomonas aeruginosa]EKF7416658.1 hypothetical protein [Pseudomonas aeruginosa]CAI9794668.1 hypothetical protein PAER4782_33785 [Pseudomonas aeruginosa]CAI9912057.1 hypothetical protein PAER4782_33785 [Pseudomonas aeruginosa]HBO1617682.1 hypothetical protein [Pseudomonas aeruginosa]HBO9385181.1 hypothetical protein [Pseudomonas aeruginosa]